LEIGRYRTSGLLLGLGPIGIALVTPRHGGLYGRKRKEKGLRAMRSGLGVEEGEEKVGGGGAFIAGAGKEKASVRGRISDPVARYSVLSISMAQSVEI